MTDYTLAKGSHQNAADGRCAMEWVSFIAGEPHSDQPVCVSPVLKSFCIAFNDALDDDTRQRLRPYLTRCIGTAGDGLDEQRAWMATDWLVRVYTPAWLDFAGLHSHACNLRALGRVISTETCKQAQPTLVAARKASAAAWDAAWDAARDAARAAAGDAAWDAARDAAWDAARDAARDAAGDAAWDALAPTVKALQDSAFDLLDRMLPGQVIELPADAAVRAELVLAGS